MTELKNLKKQLQSLSRESLQRFVCMFERISQLPEEQLQALLQVANSFRAPQSGRDE